MLPLRWPLSGVERCTGGSAFVATAGFVAPATVSPPSTGQTTRRFTWAAPLLLLTLYALSATLLLLRLAAHPSYTYNWEAYTAYGVFAFMDHPTFAIFRATEGLMT